MMAAHTNAVENLVIFAPLVLVTQALNIATPTDGVRLRAVFLVAADACRRSTPLGIPVLRTLAFAGGLVAQVILVLAIFKLN